MAAAGVSAIAASRFLPAALGLVGPGRLDEHNQQDVLIFDAGKHSFRGEPIRHFYSEEMAEMDWLRDYMMDDEVTKIASDIVDFNAIFHEEEAEETEVYNKSDLTTIESDSSWADTS